jgi:hypothetical protein
MVRGLFQLQLLVTVAARGGPRRGTVAKPYTTCHISQLGCSRWSVTAVHHNQPAREAKQATVHPTARALSISHLRHQDRGWL